MTGRPSRATHCDYMPTVSVIVPVYNRIEPLLRAIASVRAQTFQNFELLIVDDFSTLDIAPVLSSLPVRYLKSDRKGVSGARNTGIRAAAGEFIAFLDSDDEWRPLKLEKQIAYLNLHPDVSLVHSNEIWQRRGEIVKQSAKHRKSGGRVFDKCTESCVIGPSCTMVRRSLFDRVGFFDESFPVCEDFDLWLRITSQEDIGFLEEDLTIKHGGHDDQLSMQYHSMDLWRVRALSKHLKNSNLSMTEHSILRESLRKKSTYLLTGFQKHNNLENVEEIVNYLKLCEPSDPIKSHHKNNRS